MNNKLIKIAEYLAEKGLYEEASEVKKIAQTDGIRYEDLKKEAWTLGGVMEDLGLKQKKNVEPTPEEKAMMYGSISPNPEFPNRTEALPPNTLSGREVSKWTKRMMHGPHMVEVSMPEDTLNGKKQYVRHYDQEKGIWNWVELESWKRGQTVRDNVERDNAAFMGMYGKRDEALKSGKPVVWSEYERADQARNVENYDKMMAETESRNRRHMEDMNSFDAKMHAEREARRNAPPPKDNRSVFEKLRNRFLGYNKDQRTAKAAQTLYDGGFEKEAIALLKSKLKK